MSSRTQLNGNSLLTACGVALLLLLAASSPAAAQGEGPYLAWVVDEWDGEVMTAHSPGVEGGYEAMTAGAGERVVLLVVALGAPTGRAAAAARAGDPDQAVDEWDGEVMTGRSTGAGEEDGADDEAVDEWDGEVMTGRAGPTGSCTLPVGGAERQVRVLRALDLQNLAPRKARQPQK